MQSGGSVEYGNSTSLIDLQSLSCAMCNIDCLFTVSK